METWAVQREREVKIKPKINSIRTQPCGWYLVKTPIKTCSTLAYLKLWVLTLKWNFMWCQPLVKLSLPNPKVPSILTLLPTSLFMCLPFFIHPELNVLRVIFPRGPGTFSLGLSHKRKDCGSSRESFLGQEPYWEVVSISAWHIARLLLRFQSIILI